MASRAVKMLRGTGERVRKAALYERIAWARAAPVVEGQVLYESFSGNGMLDNPEAIFRHLLGADDLTYLSHVWALRDVPRFAATVAGFAGDPRVRVVEYGSQAYFDALSRSQYLVNNATFPPEFGRRDGQTYVNTWHGVPIKCMGYDIPGGGPDTRNIVRNFVSADVLLSANEFMTRQMYETAYKLRGIYRGRLVQEGSPRIDRQFVTGTERLEIRRELVRRGVALDDQQEIVLYAPTWKGSFYSPLNDAVQLLRRVRALNQRIDTSRRKVLLKVHQRVFDFAAEQPELRDVLVPNDIPTNRVLGVTDLLVTDYSSIAFDFLVTGRPVLFHLPDEATYTDERGLYVPPDRWPGPVSHDVDQLAADIDRVGTGGDDDPVVRYAEAYATARDSYCPREDGQASRRVADIVFRGRTSGYDVRDDLADGRTSLLIYVGGLRSNGITQSVLSLLDNIDYDRFDVSACYSASVNADRRRNEAAINPNVRLFPRVGGINGSKIHRLGRQAMLARGIDVGPAIERNAQLRLWRDEWVRCFGQSRFDHIVDFSGYGPFWDYVLLQGEAKTRSIFLHNDVVADSEREINGRKPLRRGLRAVFTTYPYFDNLVSVSGALCEINREKLAAYAGAEKFVSASNTVNHERVLRMAHGRPLRHPSWWHAAASPATEPVDPVDLDNLAGVVDRLSERHGLEDLLAAVQRKDSLVRLLPREPNAIAFVTAGRLSPEKNHERLVRAFALVHRDDPSTRLVIMGDGPLRANLEELVGELGLVSAVTLAGHQPNPYAVMAHADCFVLSSDYEGQPMVLLEAMVLGVPVVTTQFASVRGALPAGAGLVVEQSVGALAAGMQAFLAGNVPAPRLDWAAYNREAMRQFYVAIGADAAADATAEERGA
jgi:CDP-glycerol glycerophosphotransferase (TagB/SpsB family)